jgi:adenylate cyclase
LRFADAISMARNVFLPLALTSQNQNKKEIHPIARFGIKNAFIDSELKEANSYVPPIEDLTSVVRGLGEVMVQPDRDGVYRRIPLFTRFGNHLFPVLSAAPLKEQFRFREGKILLNQKPLHTGAKGDLFLWYYGGDFDFPRFNALEIISAHQRPDSEKSRQLAQQLKDRFIIIALTAPGLYDLKPTPVAAVSHGAHVHGILLANLLNGHHLNQVDAVWKFIAIFILGTLLGFAIIMIVSFWKNILIFLATIFGCALLSYSIFLNYQLWTGFLVFHASFFIIFCLTSTYSYNTEGKRRRMIRRLFSQYMSEPLVRELEAHPHRAKLGGEKRIVTVFFSDLANFTNLSEKLDAEILVGMLNDYFSVMSRIIIDNKGYIDKYQGDGIMAFWGAPVRVDAHAPLACRAAIECQQEMKSINDQVTGMGLPALHMRIGLHTGEVVVGNMGSTQKLDYTIIGDDVNLASRLEGANKQYQTHTLISESTYEMSEGEIEARELDLIAVKGKEKPIKIFQLLALKNEFESPARELKSRYEQGLRLYRERDFREACRMFEGALELNPDDYPARIFVERCREFMVSPPPDQWDGVFRLTEK